MIKIKKRTMVVLGIILFTQFSSWPLAADTKQQNRRSLPIEYEPWTGDFKQMLDRRLIRVLVPYSRTLYYNDKGQERGTAAELVRDFERYLNKKYAKLLKKRPVTVFIKPATRSLLLDDLVNGKGDIVAGNLTETKDRLKQVDFVAPKDRTPYQELILTRKGSTPINSLDDLSGKTVHVRKSSSYFESLNSLNDKFKKKGKKPIEIVLVPNNLEDEDLMEMLNAGLFQMLVVDDWKAKIWSQVLPKIKVNDIAVRKDAYTGWAIRKNSPELAESLNDFYQNWAKKQHVIEYRIAKFQKNIKQITNNTSGRNWKQFENILKIFEKYGNQYNFEPLMLAAQGYQESQLKQEKRSRVGAIGVMQIMPKTGKDLKVGNIHLVEANIHAGAKYMDHMMSTYFSDAHFNEKNRILFAFASYNAGPTRISKLRKVAEERGYDPNLWFDNVEIVVAEKVGIETTTYVRNIYKYYAAYQLQLQVQEKQREARKKAKPF